VESKSLTCSSFFSSSPPSISISFYFSLCFSLFVFSVKQRRSNPFFSLHLTLSVSSLQRERDSFFFALPIELGWTQWSNTNNLHFPWREAHQSSSHYLVSMPTSRRQSSSLSFRTIFVSIYDGFLSV
jgi:hypothetical protein